MKLDFFEPEQIRALMLMYKVKPLDLAKALQTSEKTITRVMYSDTGKDVASFISKVAVSHYLKKTIEDQNGIENPLASLPTEARMKIGA